MHSKVGRFRVVPLQFSLPALVALCLAAIAGMVSVVGLFRPKN